MTEYYETRMVYTVAKARHGQRLDVYLAEMTSPEFSRSRLKNLIEEGLVLVDGKRAKAGQKLKAGQDVALTVPEPKPVEMTPDPDVDFEVLYQDQDIIVINKPPGLVVHPAVGHYTGTLVHGLLAVCSDLSGVSGELRPGIVHRLDMDTSGILVAAKNDRAHNALAASFKDRTVTKTYLAVCLGWPGTRRGEIDRPIGRHPIKRNEMSVHSTNAKRALTRYEVLEMYQPGASLLRVNILTGRTHQIRVHLTAIGHPILGDRLYGKSAQALKDGGKFPGDLIKRQMLHASRLKLTHPVQGRIMEFEAPLPPDMNSVLDALRAGGLRSA